MEAVVWLRIEGKKGRYGTPWVPGTIAVAKSKPSPRDNEVAVKITLEIPDAVFDEPVFEAKLKLPETTRNFPEKTEIAQHLGAALSEKMGFRVKVDMSGPNEEMHG
jgi:hypothetical protein